MPIDDVDYLKQNSIKQSYMFLVDSKDRDRNAYPDPSQYTVTFTTPFQNVVGFQLIESSIPRTMYNVDVRNNSLAFFIHDSSFSISNLHTSNYIGADGSRTVDIGDYTIQTLITALNGNVNNDPTLPLVLEMFVNNDSNHPAGMAKIIAETLSNPPETKNIIRFRCSYPFVIDMANSSIAETLGFDLFVQPLTEIRKPILEQRYTSFNAKYTIASNNGSNYSYNIPNNQLYHSVDIPPSISLGEQYIAFEGPRGVVRNQTISSGNYIAQAFTVSDQAYFTQLNAALYLDPLYTNGGISVNQIAFWTLYTSSNNLPKNIIQTSNLNRATSNYDLLQSSNAIAVTSIDGAYSDTNTDFQVFLNPGTYWIVMTSKTNIISLFYNDIPSYTDYQPFLYATSTIQSPVTSNLQWNSLNDNANGVFFQASLQIILQDTYHYLTGPGIYSLIGERYIIVRCPEIEEHSYRSLAYTKHCLGLAKIKLGVVGYSENSGDFSSVPLREFHPIGRLSRITMRFETLTGELYDFKGVNHTLTFAIYYYEPVQKGIFTNSILNPNYNGNYLEYMQSIEAEEDDSDDQEEEYSRDAPQNYQVIESRHLPEAVNRLDQEALYRFNFGNSD
jgi:hypothetical protein